jgi:hypothetical protein
MKSTTIAIARGVVFQLKRRILTFKPNVLKLAFYGVGCMSAVEANEPTNSALGGIHPFRFRVSLNDRFLAFRMTGLGTMLQLTNDRSPAG